MSPFLLQRPDVGAFCAEMHLSEIGIGRRPRLTIRMLRGLVLRVATRCGLHAAGPADARSLMPDTDGIETLSHLQALGVKDHLIIISGQDDWLRKQARDLALTRGLNVADEMGKPLDLNGPRGLLMRLAGATMTVSVSTRRSDLS